MKILKTKKKKTTTETITHETDLGFSIVETVVNGKHKGVGLIAGKKAAKLELQPFLLDLPKDWVEKYEDFYDLFDYQVKPEKIEDVDEDKIFFVYNSGHMLFDKKQQIVSIPCLFNYIGSLREKEPNDPIYARLIELLKKHPYVLSLEEEEIPSYNSEFGGQKAIKKAKVFLPQDKYKELYEKCKDDKFWSVRMNNHIKMSFGCAGVYGEEVDKLLKEHWKIKDPV